MDIYTSLNSYYMHVNIHTYAYAYIHTYVHIYTYIYIFTYVAYVCVWYSLEWLTGCDPASSTTAVSQWQVQEFIMLDASTGCRNPKEIHS